MDSTVGVNETGDHRSQAVDTCTREELMELLNRYERPLFNFLVVLLRDRAAAEDCAQDTFLRGYEHLQQDRKVTGTWLYRVARNRAVDELRRRARLQSGEAELDAAPDFDEGDAGLRARRALALLSVEDRELLYLFDVDEFSAREIANMLGIRPGTVHVRVFRARERLRRHYRAGEDTA